MRVAREAPIVIALAVALASCSLPRQEAAFERDVGYHGWDEVTAVWGVQASEEAAEVTSAATQRPTWTLTVSFGVYRATHEWEASECPHVRFVSPDRIIVAQHAPDRCEGAICSIERGELERTFPWFPDHFDPVAPRAIVSQDDRSPTELVDLVTGTRTSLLGVIDPTQGRSCALLPARDAVAVFVAPDRVEIRSTRDRTVQNVVTLPEPPERTGDHRRVYDIETLRLSADGDRLAVVCDVGIATPDVQVCDLATGGNWAPLQGVIPIGFGPNSLVYLQRMDDGSLFGRGFAIGIMHADGSWQALSDVTVRGGNECALSATGELLAFVKRVGPRDDPEIVVRLTGRARVLRRLPMRLDRALHGLALSARGERLAVVYDDGLIDVYELPR